MRHGFSVSFAKVICWRMNLPLVDKEKFFDMPQLFDELVAAGQKTSVYPVRNY